MYMDILENTFCSLCWGLLSIKKPNNNSLGQQRMKLFERNLHSGEILQLWKGEICFLKHAHIHCSFVCVMNVL